jgi:integrase
MAKSTYGNGYLRPRGKKWYGYIRIIVKDPETGDRVPDRIPVILGERASMTRKQAREALARESAKRKGWFTANAPVLNDSRVTFDWFVRNRYIPLKKGDWKEETAKNKIALIESDLLEDLGDIPLRNFTRYDLQMQVNKLAETRSRDRVLQIRAYLRDIFSEALDQDFLVKDPALRVKVSGQLKQTDKTTLTWDQLRMVLDELTAMERILVELDITEALRPSELFALRWKCFDSKHSSLRLQETVYKGKIRNWGKTTKSLSTIHLPSALAVDLAAWKKICPDSSPEAFIFPNQDGGFMDADNFRKRVLHRIAVKLGLPKLTFQVIRRAVATLAQHLGSVKDVQGLLRHENPSLAAEVYMQEIPESVRRTVNSIHKELRKRRPGVGRKPRISASGENRPEAKVKRSQIKLAPIGAKRSEADSGGPAVSL